MPSFSYYRPSDRVTLGTWSLGTGVARTNFPIASIAETVADPSNPAWISGTSIGAINSFGAPQRIDTVYIVAHTFVNAANLHVQMHTSSSWATPDVDIAVPVPAPWEDGFTYHLRVDVAAAYPVAANRTKAFLRIANLSANSVSVAIGEVWMAAIPERRFTRPVDWPVEQPRQRMTALLKSKKGVVTAYDYGPVERRLVVSVSATDADQDSLRSLETDAHYNALPFPVVLSPADAKARRAEPMIVRFASPVSNVPYNRHGHTAIPVALDEAGCGELVGA